MQLDIRINGQIYTLWETATVSRSLDNVCGQFGFTTSLRGDYPVQDGDQVQVLVNSKVWLTGYVFDLTSNYGIGSSYVSIAGRDLTADLVDSSVPDSAKVLSGGTIIDMCRAVVNGLGLPIKVIDQTGGVAPFATADLETAEVGGNCFDFLSSFARRRQVYLITSRDGDLIVYRPSGVTATTQIINKHDSANRNNVLSCTVRRSSMDRYYRYRISSQDSVADNDIDYSGTGTDNNGEAIDNDIRQLRYLEVIAEEPMAPTDCSARAKEESNLRRARGLDYSATIAGVTQRDGSLWEPGQLVRVDDDILNVIGTFIIRRVQLDVDLGSPASGGSRTTLTVAQPDAYKAQDVVQPTTGRIAKIDKQ
jgi:prophage tail gpP-like protein